MDTKKMAMGTIAGGITSFFLGFLVYGVALTAFYEANSLHPEVMLETPRWLWLVLGQFGIAGFFTFVLMQWTGVNSFAAGAKAGAVMGILYGAGVSLTWYGTTDMMTMTGALADIVVTGLLTAITCGVIATVIGRD